MINSVRLRNVLVPLFLIGTLLVLALLPDSPPSETPSPNFGTENLSEIKIGDQTLFVEIADDDAERNQGLSGREDLPENQGMLFVFGKPDYYTFWMKGMRFPLDFIWISGDKKVVEITENVPPLSPDTQSPSIVKPSQAAQYVLEVNAGWVGTRRIKIGDPVGF